MKKRIVSVLSTLVGAAIGAVIVGMIREEEVQKWKGYSSKHLSLYKMMCQWVSIKQESKNLADYFEKKGYRKIAVYGMSYMGDVLVDELKDTNIQVAYGIDKNASSIYSEIDVLTMGDELAEVDVVVVTAITFFDEIEQTLSKKMDCPIISLEEVLSEVV